MASGNRVELDTSDLVRGMHQLARGLERAGGRVGQQQASRTASDIRAGTPVLTGRLRASVTVVTERDGAAVTYGAGLPYADYIEGRVGMVEDALDDAPDEFERAMTLAAETEVRAL